MTVRRTKYHLPINRADKPAHPNRRFLIKGRLGRCSDWHTVAVVKSPGTCNFVAWLHELIGYRIVVYSILVPEDWKGKI